VFTPPPPERSTKKKDPPNKGQITKKKLSELKRQQSLQVESPAVTPTKRKATSDPDSDKDTTNNGFFLSYLNTYLYNLDDMESEEEEGEEEADTR
jgi:hypothetical protein